MHILNKLNRYYPQKLMGRYNLEGGQIELNLEEAYNKIGVKIGATRGGETDYERVSNRIINDIKDEYIKGIVFDNEI